MSASGTGRVYGGVTAEERTAERRQRLIEAAMNLFGSGESGCTRVKDVVAEARLTERYFYESFADLDALFDAVLRLCMNRVDVEVTAAVDKAPDEAVSRISIALRTAVDTLVADPRMIRIIFVEALGQGGRAGSRRNAILVLTAANFVRWSGPNGVDFASSSIEARLRALAISGAASELLISWTEGILDITPSELTEFLVGLYWRINLP